MEPSDCPAKTMSDTAKGEMAVPSSSSRSADKESSSGNRERSSRRKPMKTHKVAANFEEDDHYDDYLRDGIPDALLKGLEFNENADCGAESDNHSYADYDIDEDGMHDNSSITTNFSGVRGGQAGGKRRGRPPGRGRGRGTPVQPIVIQPSSAPAGSAPTIARRRGRPPKTITPVRVQPVRVITPAPIRTPLQPPVKQKQTLNQFRPQVNIAAKPNTLQQVHPSTSRNQQSTISSEQSMVASAAALSILPVTEFNVWPVLEKLLAATQSMGMLLGSLKDDLKRTSAILAASAAASTGLEHSKKRREVSTKLWRAFVAYKKSFDEIESFTRNTGSSNGSSGVQSPVAGSGTLPQKLHNVQSASNLVKKINTPQSTPNSMQKKQASQCTPTAQFTQVTPHSKMTAAIPNIEVQPSSVSRRRPRPVNSNVVIELSDSDEEDENIDEPPVKKQCKVEVVSSSMAPSESYSTKSPQSTPDSTQKNQTSQCASTEQSSRVTHSNSYLFKGQAEKEQQPESGSTEMPEYNELSTTCDEQQTIDSVATACSNDATAEMLEEKNVNPAKTVRKTANPDTPLETSSTDVTIGSHTTDEQQNGVSELNVNAKETSKTEQTLSPCADVKLEAVSVTAENVLLTNNEPKSSSTTKTELFSSLRFEPLFEIQPLNGSKS